MDFRRICPLTLGSSRQARSRRILTVVEASVDVPCEDNVLQCPAWRRCGLCMLVAHCARLCVVNSSNRAYSSTAPDLMSYSFSFSLLASERTSEFDGDGTVGDRGSFDHGLEPRLNGLGTSLMQVQYAIIRLQYFGERQSSL
jgi:hypothetical protein